MTERQMTNEVKCITCDNHAQHFMEYFTVDEITRWGGFYCNKCFVKKLRGMASVWSKRDTTSKEDCKE